jgi:hypothetical protein
MLGHLFLKVKESLFKFKSHHSVNTIRDTRPCQVVVGQKEWLLLFAMSVSYQCINPPR